MTKNEIALDKNFNTYRISREIQTDYPLEYQEGNVITFDNPSSWTDGGHFEVETSREYSYVFWINNNIDVHKVDYENEEECDVLGCDDCMIENEVLLESGIQLRITSIIRADDEVPFTTIETELIK